MSLFKEVENKSRRNTLINILKITVIILLIINIISIFIILKLSSQKQVVVGITEEGVPLKLENKNNSVGNLVNYQRFITEFLNLLYDWNADSYKNNIKSAINYMSDDLEEQYIEEVQRGGYIEQVQEYEITNSLTIQNIDVDSIQEYEDGYRVEVKALKLKITDFIDRTIPVTIQLGFRTTDISKDNIWGLEIFEIKESNRNE